MKSLLMTAENGSKIHNKAKTMTRRLQGLEKVNEKPEEWKLLHYTNGIVTFANTEFMKQLNVNEFIDVKPRFQSGDIVSIREPHYLWGYWGTIWIDGKKQQKFMRVSRIGNNVYYPDNPPDKIYTGWEYEIGWHLRPGMFMFEKDVRSHVRITEVICQRLQEISHQDITAEGLGEGYTDIGWNYAFGQLWNSINLKMDWNFNPWVFGYRMELTEVN